jgi:LTXXQ motif family protein
MANYIRAQGPIDHCRVFNCRHGYEPPSGEQSIALVRGEPRRPLHVVRRARIDRRMSVTAAIANLVLVLTMLAASSVAQAQFPGGGAGAGGGGMGRGTGGMGGPSGRASPVDTSAAISSPGRASDMQADIIGLRDDLQLTQAQQASFDAYIAMLFSLAGDVQRSQFAMRSPPNADSRGPQQFDQLVDIARNRLTAVEEIAEAGSALYAKLSPEQKLVADRRLVAIAVPLLAGGSMRATTDANLRGARGGPP